MVSLAARYAWMSEGANRQMGGRTITVLNVAPIYAGDSTWMTRLATMSLVCSP